MMVWGERLATPRTPTEFLDRLHRRCFTSFLTSAWMGHGVYALYYA